MNPAQAGATDQPRERPAAPSSSAAAGYQRTTIRAAACASSALRLGKQAAHFRGGRQRAGTLKRGADLGSLIIGDCKHGDEYGRRDGGGRGSPSAAVSAFLTRPRAFCHQPARELALPPAAWRCRRLSAAGFQQLSAALSIPCHRRAT